MGVYTRNQWRRKLLVEQRLMGVGLLAISAIVLAFAITATRVEDKDCTILFVTLPLGFTLLFSKRIWIA